MCRAIVFDLDETLYRERRFMLSGFLAVAHMVERLFAVPAAEAFALLRRALARGQRGTALQELCVRFGLPAQTVGEFRALILGHQPRLRLPRESAAVLSKLRRDWKVGILTNGPAETQARKVAALGLVRKVDAIVYASDTGPGKPDPASFETVLDRLDARASESVFVGDDPWCDVFGARWVGMKTIRIHRGVHDRALAAPLYEADAVVGSLVAVPAVAAALLRKAERRVA